MPPPQPYLPEEEILGRTCPALLGQYGVYSCKWICDMVGTVHPTARNWWWCEVSGIVGAGAVSLMRDKLSSRLCHHIIDASVGDNSASSCVCVSVRLWPGPIG